VRQLHELKDELDAMLDNLPEGWEPPVIPTVVNGPVVAGWVNHQPFIRFTGSIEGMSGHELATAIVSAIDDLHDMLGQTGTPL
jgi:hypothetical protein